VIGAVILWVRVERSTWKAHAAHCRAELASFGEEEVVGTPVPTT
jgi:hypothetical protein